MQEESVQQPANGAMNPAENQKSLEELLAEAQAKIEQQRDTMLRAVADAENARKRAQTEAASAQKYALERFAERLLPVMDSLEAALRSGHLGGDVSGVQLTLKQLAEALEKSEHPADRAQGGRALRPPSPPGDGGRRSPAG